MGQHLIPLAVLAAITSPTSIAAVLAILRRSRAVWVLASYLVGSFVASMLIGIAIVAGLGATELLAPRHGTALPVFDISIGLLILVSAVWLRSGRSAATRRRLSEARARRRATRHASTEDGPSRASRILNSGSIGLVAALGAAMHLPGLLYLAALGTIAQADPSTSHALVLLALFNIVMLAPIELPLLGAIFAPRRTQEAVGAVDAFIRRHWTEGLLIASVIAGGYLIVIGIVGLVG